MIFAAITETPCIAIGNYNYKVKGVYDWISELNYIYFVEDIETAKEKINELLQLENEKNNIKLKKYYESLKREIGE